MQRAHDEALRGWGRVSPNPLVGCTVLNSKHELISTGYHAMYGQAHAEVHALQKLSRTDLDGAHVVVTLEPCSHYGKTPPCAKLLSELPIESVTYAVLDPNPLVAGKGLDFLKKANKKVVFLESYQRKCFQLAETFLYPMKYQKPFVAMKVSMSEDEAIALAESDERLILSNETALMHVHYLRAQYDAILVGKNTILKDNPKLNIRHPDFLDKENKVVILDTKGELRSQKHLNIFKYHKPENILFISQKSDAENVIACPLKNSGQMDLDAVLKILFEKGIRSLFVEGGAAVYRSFLEQSIPQRFYIYKTPHRLFEKGLHWCGGIASVESLNLTEVSTLQLGDNLLRTGVYGSYLP